MTERMNGCDRRKQLVEISFQLFSSYGFSGTTIRHIAQAAGVSEATLYKYFPTKRDLYRAIIEEKIKCLFHDLPDFDEEKSDDPKKIFKQMALTKLRAIYRDDGPTRFLMFSLLENKDITNMFYEEYLSYWHRKMSRYISNLSNKGHFKEVDQYLALLSFYGPLFLLDIRKNIFGMHVLPEDKLEEVADSFIEIFFNGISKRRA